MSFEGTLLRCPFFCANLPNAGYSRSILLLAIENPGNEGWHGPSDVKRLLARGSTMTMGNLRFAHVTHHPQRKG